MPSPIDISSLWTVSGILLGFQMTAFTWRISTELKMAEKNQPVWLPPADYLNLMAMVVTVFGIFVLPIFGIVCPQSLRVLFGLAVLLFLGHAFALAGHYELFSRGSEKPNKWCSRQEIIIIFLVAIIVVTYLVTAAFIF